MHPSIAKRITVLDGLRARAHQATAEFYQKPGVQPPPLAPLIIVCPSGNNTFSLINRATGVVVAERFGHNNATTHARELEAKEAQFNVKQFGKFLSRWTLRVGITMTVLAFFSTQM
ncbi:hypothetical protein [Pseudomonas psychrophila]|uniref:hypothetical protein n=1 Tax=Pseudomonas psychrophila TaxID=122355 RepID=UPI000356FEDE|nr:hypothetical protein [Pseudomonas psychrophila]EPJ90996.1 hypothetical protein CF149_23461 [Pseudomonas psychrophila]